MGSCSQPCPSQCEQVIHFSGGAFGLTLDLAVSFAAIQFFCCYILVWRHHSSSPVTILCRNLSLWLHVACFRTTSWEAMGNRVSLWCLLSSGPSRSVPFSSKMLLLNFNDDQFQVVVSSTLCCLLAVVYSRQKAKMHFFLLGAFIKL